MVPIDSSFSRREALKLGGLAAIAGAAGGVGALARSASGQAARFGSAVPTDASVDLFMNMNASAQVRATGNATSVWKYDGVVTAGNPGILTPGPSYLGPTFTVQRGQQLHVRMVNNLDQETITHWHGLDVPSVADGHPRDVVPPGAAYHYSFRVLNRAGTYWYHPHPDMLTGSQVAKGLAGLFIVQDAEEQRLALPRGVYDIPLVIQDRRFNASNQFVYQTGPLFGFLGTSVLVNGQENYVHQCAQRVYRMRVLNGSNSRIYKLAFSDGTPLVVIGSDGGLLTRPVTKPYIMLSPGERVELWVDLRGKAIGSEIKLRSLAFNPLLGTNAPLPAGAAFDICTFRMQFGGNETLVGPPKFLSPVPLLNAAEAVNLNEPRVWNVMFDIGMGHFLINGAMYDVNSVLPNEIVRAGDLEIVEFNNPYIAGLSMPHPMHIHGRQFQVLERNILDPAALESYAGVRDGFLDEGWKDTFILWPGEQVRILVRWSDYAGLFVYHCHNLEHEDMHMMRNFRIDR
ncbi:MAG TPA: multicopper oxidase domain-containing protein [Phycisphaerales bacterium]|nr:multicopper oxidase domain-containing protein [Phycisphaerales bacterium]